MKKNSGLNGIPTHDLYDTSAPPTELSCQLGAGHGPGGGGSLLYGLYRYVWPQWVWFFSRFGHKLGIDFSPFAAILLINGVSIFAL